MYDFPEVRGDNDRLWRDIADALRSRRVRGVPDSLTRDAALPAAWLDTDLLLSQTCGYPLATALAGRVTLLATPCYSADGCAGPTYRSWLVARRGAGPRGLSDFHRRVVAINAHNSLSGCQVFRILLNGEPLEHFFSRVVVSGAHERSLAAVASGDADVAAIDCVTWALLARHRPAALQAVDIVGEGPPLPALPFITSLSTEGRVVDTIREVLAAVVRGRNAPYLERLLLSDVSCLEWCDYERIVEILAPV